MPFLLAEILNFQGSTHHIGVGSFSNVYYKADAKRSDKVPMAHLDQLTVHAVNLEGLN